LAAAAAVARVYRRLNLRRKGDSGFAPENKFPKPACF
jgi:hypothetical protein